MKKKLYFMVSILIIFASCVTSNQQGVMELNGLPIHYNEFEKQDWIQIESVELYKDSDSIYVDVTYNASVSGEYSFFNPPNGDIFKKLGVIDGSKAHLVETIGKDDFQSLKETTFLFFNGNDNERAGFFFKVDHIDFNSIPPARESQLALVASEGIQKKSQDSSMGVMTLKAFDTTFLEKLPPHRIEKGSYEWRGRKIVGDFVISDNIEKVQAFVNNFDPSKIYELEDIYEQIGEPLYYEQEDDILFSKDALGEAYSLVYAASSELTSCLSVNIWDNQLRGLETKYSGFYKLNDLYLGQKIEESKQFLTVKETVFKDEAWVKEKEEGFDSTDQYIVEYELFSTYKDLSGGYQLIWHNTGELYQIELVLHRG